MAGTIREGMAEYIRDAGIADAHPTQIKETRRAFYAGAHHILDILFGLGADEISEDQGAATLEALTQECRNFAVDIRHGRA